MNDFHLEYAAFEALRIASNMKTGVRSVEVRCGERFARAPRISEDFENCGDPLRIAVVDGDFGGFRSELTLALSDRILAACNPLAVGM